MKKLLYLICILHLQFVFSQVDEIHTYTTLEPILVYGYNFTEGVIDKDKRRVLKEGLEFRKIGDPIESGDTDLKTIIVISVYNIISESIETKDSSKYVNKRDNGEFFCIPLNKFKENNNVAKKFKTWNKNFQITLGTLIIPAKIRLSENEVPTNFTPSYTLGTNIGVKMRMSPYKPFYLSLVAFFGLTSVNVDSATSSGKKIESENLSALTPAFGIVFEFSDIQIGMLMGWDFIGGETSKHWIYQGKKWFSLGLGYQFLKSK